MTSEPFHSRVFATEAERDAWARDFAEAGRRNYEALVNRRSDAFDEGVKVAFLKRLKRRAARKRLAQHMGVDKLTPAAIQSHANKAFERSSRFSESKGWNKIRRLAREAGFDTMGRELASV